MNMPSYPPARSLLRNIALALVGVLILGAAAKPTPLADEGGGTVHRATGVKSFEGMETPNIKWVVAENKYDKDDFVHIADAGENTVRMTLRYFPQWWDGDPATKSKDRQRAEVKGLGPHQKDGETFEYQTTWRADPDFKGGGRFCHIFQLKATDGDDGAPLVTMSILEGNRDACVHYWPGKSRGFKMVRAFHWKPGEWMTVAIRIKTSTKEDGEVMVSVNGDAFQGVQNVAVYRPQSDDYRPKWGLYRGISDNLPTGESWIEHKNVSARKL